MSALPWKIGELIEACGGQVLSPGDRGEFAAIGIDSRTITPDALFVAIAGEVHDGHGFIGDVLAKGVRGLVVAADRAGGLPVADWRRDGIFCLAVPDTTRALGALARWRRRRLGVSVAAITGSNGKTTTRAMTAAVLSRRFRLLETSGNFNNQIGLPLTLFGLQPDHRWAVLELGTNHPGEIRRLARICLPDVGVITNIAPAHLEGLGSIEGVRLAKRELLEELNPGGTAVLNRDDPNVTRMADEVDRPVLFFGRHAEAVVRGDDIHVSGQGLVFTLQLPDETGPVHLRTPARFMVANALAAAAVGLVVGLTAAEIRDGLEDFVPVKGRLNILELADDIVIIDDTYNANPGSMKVALETLMALPGGSRTVFVAGDMKELGRRERALHTEVGALAARCGVDRIVVCGRFAEDLAAGARAAGMSAAAVTVAERQEIIDRIEEWLRPGDRVLVKGSRAMAMEAVVERLRQRGGDGRLGRA